MMPIAPHQADRDSILAALLALDCDFGEADQFRQFLDNRAELLAQLDAVKDPWTQAQRAALQEALVHGGQVLAEAHKQRSLMVKQIDRLRGAKRAAKGHDLGLPARLKRLF